MKILPDLRRSIFDRAIALRLFPVAFYNTMLSLGLILLMTGSDLFGQNWPCKGNNCVDNGIGVSDPKIFDNRTLMIMLEELSRQLQSLKVIDQKSLVDNLGLAQGYQSKDVSRAFELGMAPSPAISTTSKPNADGVLTVSEQTTDQKELSAKSPGIPELMAAPKYEPAFGVNAEDLLSQQIDLTYKIFNLRMLLERSISDRLVANETNSDSLSENGSRLQAVLGFNVRLNPPRESKDMAAFVEVTVKVDGSDKPISLVAMMPQEKTYNTSALSTKSNAFGGSAVFKIFTIGYSERRRGQTFYLYQDADTITFQPMRQEGDLSKVAPTFGWEFRPVLGRRSVSAGERPLFAVISLDKRDLIGNTDLSKLNVSVRTYWRKYDRKTMTVDRREVNENKFEYKNTVVPTTTRFQNNLLPRINRVSWVPIGSRSALVSVSGENFFSNTQVTIGDRTLSGPSDGLIIKSDQLIEFAAGLELLASGPGAIIGRYGAGVPIVKSLGGSGINIANGTAFGESLAGLRDLTVILESRSSGDLNFKDLPSNPSLGPLVPIISINNKVLPFPYTMIENTATKKIELQTSFSDDLLIKGGGVIKVTFPFLSSDWTASYRFYDPGQTFDARPFGAKSLLVTTKDPRGFRPVHQDFKCWSLVLGDEVFSVKNRNRITQNGAVDLTPCVKEDGNLKDIETISDFAFKADLKDSVPATVFLISPEKTVFQLEVSIPDRSTTPSGPKPIELNEGDSVWVDIEVDDASKIKRVEANEKTLESRSTPSTDASKPSKSLSIYVTKQVTSQGGSNIDLTFYGSDGKPVGKRVRLYIKPCANCGKENK